GVLHRRRAVRRQHVRAALRRRGLLLGESRRARLRRLAAGQHRRRGRRGDEAGRRQDPPGVMPAVRYELRGDAAWITLDQPERRNALSDALVAELRAGVIPAMISVLCIRKLGIQQAMWLFLTGERVSAARAVELGLIPRAVPADRLDATVEEVLDLVRLGGPNAVREAKQLVRR